ncbi:MAG TPA: hypothetical protein VF230_06340 [Acidimicrobiales bacterium]
MDPGAVLVVVAVVLVLPPLFMMLGLLVSAAIGWTAKTNAEAVHEGSELIETNY